MQGFTPSIVKLLIAASLTLCGLLRPAASAAQVGEARNILALGVNGGVALNRVSFDPSVNQIFQMGPAFGFTMRYTCEKYFAMICAIQIEANYVRAGWKEDILGSDSQPLPDTYQRDIDYLQIPVMARLGFGREKRGAQGFLVAGPQIGYAVRESAKRSDVWTLNAAGVPDRVNNTYEQYDMPLKHKFDYGITAGLGLEISTKIGHFLVEGRYYYGLSDLFGNSKKDTFGRSANGTIIGKLTYLIDLGGQ